MRTLAALLGGYALAHTLPVALFALLPVGRAEASLWAVQLSFVVYAAAALWAFGAGTAGRAWGWLAGLTVLTGALAWWAL